MLKVKDSSTQCSDLMEFYYVKLRPYFAPVTGQKQQKEAGLYFYKQAPHKEMLPILPVL